MLQNPLSRGLKAKGCASCASHFTDITLQSTREPGAELRENLQESLKS